MGVCKCVCPGSCPQTLGVGDRKRVVLHRDPESGQAPPSPYCCFSWIPDGTASLVPVPRTKSQSLKPWSVGVNSFSIQEALLWGRLEAQPGQENRSQVENPSSARPRSGSAPRAPRFSPRLLPPGAHAKTIAL